LIYRLTSNTPSSSFYHRISSFLVLGIVTLLLTAAPFKLGAQQAAPGTGDYAGSMVGTAALDERPTQEEQNKQFLIGGPIVKWTAQKFNTSV